MKKNLIDLAAFMCESGINNFGKCKKFERQKKAAAFMLREYSLDYTFENFDMVLTMSDAQYLEYKIYFVLLVAESLPKEIKEIINYTPIKKAA